MQATADLRKAQWKSGTLPPVAKAILQRASQEILVTPVKKERVEAHIKTLEEQQGKLTEIETYVRDTTYQLGLDDLEKEFTTPY